MSSYVSVQITCPHCDKTHRFTMVPEGEAVKESGEKHLQKAQPPEELAEKLQELKGKPSERADAIRKQLADLEDKGEQERKILPESIEKGLFSGRGKLRRSQNWPKSGVPAC